MHHAWSSLQLQQDPATCLHQLMRTNYILRFLTLWSVTPQWWLEISHETGQYHKYELFVSFSRKLIYQDITGHVRHKPRENSQLLQCSLFYNNLQFANFWTNHLTSLWFLFSRYKVKESDQKASRNSFFKQNLIHTSTFIYILYLLIIYR